LQLRIPGPTPLPPAVREAGSRDMIDHRGPEFAELLRDVTARLKPFFQTVNDVLILTASGTGALEAAIVNMVSPGDRVLAITIGAFGDRFAEIAEAFGAAVTRLTFPAGQAADPGTVAEAFERQGPFKAVLVTHNETSTGVTNDLESIARIVAPTPSLLIVDAISSLSSIDLKTDAWGCDVVASGSQKGWMTPPGLAMVSVSQKAWQAYETAMAPRFYWDFGKARAYAKNGQTPATPAVSLFYALQAGLTQMEREGMANIFARHARCAERARQGITTIGLEHFADPLHASNTVTSVRAPAEVEVARLLKDLRERGVVLSGGQAALAGKIFRIGHLGFVDVADIDEVIGALADVLARYRTVGSALRGG
jgi:aspartate aminotransferase-like enzyme